MRYNTIQRETFPWKECRSDYCQTPQESNTAVERTLSQPKVQTPPEIHDT